MYKNIYVYIIKTIINNKLNLKILKINNYILKNFILYYIYIKSYLKIKFFLLLYILINMCEFLL